MRHRPLSSSRSPGAPRPRCAAAPAAEDTSAPTGYELAGAAEHRCTSADLSLSIGEPRGTRQKTVSLTFTDASRAACARCGPARSGRSERARLRAAPPRRQPAADPHALIPGASTVAPLTHLLAKPGSAGAPGSVGWVPTHLGVTPPGDSGTLSVAWSSTDPVLREDPAEHPATFVGAFTHV